MGNVMTRAKPNAFNALHQLKRRLKLGESVTQVVGSYESGKAPRAIFGMTPAETAAVVNLIHHLPPAATDVLAKGVAEYGIIKGPITHAGIAAPSMRVGAQPDVIAEDWAKALANTASSLTLAVNRVLEDFKCQPLCLRKSAGAPEMTKLTRIARAWELVLAKLSNMIPQAHFDSEKSRLEALFHQRAFDDWLYSLTEECPAELDVRKCSEITAIVAKHRASMEKDKNNNPFAEFC